LFFENCKIVNEVDSTIHKLIRIQTGVHIVETLAYTYSSQSYVCTTLNYVARYIETCYHIRKRSRRRQSS